MRWQIGDFEYNSSTRWLHYVGTDPKESGHKKRLAPREAKLLDALIDYRLKNETFESAGLRDKLWGKTHVKISSLHRAASNLRKAFKDTDYTYISSPPYSLGYDPNLVGDRKAAKPLTSSHHATNLHSVSEQLFLQNPAVSFISAAGVMSASVPQSQDEAPRSTDTIIPIAFDLQSPFSAGFVLSLDNMTVNLVSDLLAEDGPPSIILHLCRRSYQRSLEDFAFAVVYGTRVATGRNFRGSTSDYVDRRLTLIDQLGPIWEYQPFDDSLKKGAALTDPRCEPGIRHDLELLDKSITLSKWPFREWILYSAYRHLGDDESLQYNDLSPADYKYDLGDSPFYRNTFLENRIAPRVLELLSRYAREGILRDPGKPADNALKHFVRGGLLNLITVMHEYRISCDDLGYFRIPHVLRSVIQQTPTSSSATHNQQHLRTLIIHHALATAFRKIDNINKRSLVTELLGLRELPPFCTLRHILDDASLTLADPQADKEGIAKRLHSEFRLRTNPLVPYGEYFAIGDHAILRDRRSPQQYAAIRELMNFDEDEYTTRLYKVFPELSQTYVVGPGT